MTVTQSVLLGLLQGAAEFLPISSSGHLAVMQRLFGLDDLPLLFDIMLHLATLLAVVLYFRKRLWVLIKAFFRWAARKPLLSNEAMQDAADKGILRELKTSSLTRTDNDARRTVEAIIFASIATGCIGLLLEKTVKNIPVFVVCALFLSTAAVLAASNIIANKRAEKVQSAHNENSALSAAPLSFSSSPGLWASIIIGAAQGIGVLPGLSRSGMTISAALLCGLDGEAAGEFSFIISIPAILGAFLLQLKDIKTASAIGLLPIAAGMIAAFVAGYAALVFLMRIIKRGRLGWFAAYLVPAGILGMMYFR